MPWPVGSAGKPRREAVDGDEHRRQPYRNLIIEQLRQLAVKRLLDLVEALLPRLAGQPAVGRNRRAVTLFGKAIRSIEGAVAVDDQPTVALQHQWRIEQR